MALAPIRDEQLASDDAAEAEGGDVVTEPDGDEADADDALGDQAAVTAPGGEPDWVRAAWRALRGEVAAYLRVARLSLTAPRRFCADWADGRVRTLNPILVALNTAAILGGMRLVAAHLLHLGDGPWWIDPVRPLLLLLVAILASTTLHLLLRLLGSRRRLPTTVGVALNLQAGADLVITLTLGSAQVLSRRFLGVHPLASACLGLAMVLARLPWHTVGMAAAHRLPHWRVALALSVATAVSLALALALAMAHALG